MSAGVLLLPVELRHLFSAMDLAAYAPQLVAETATISPEFAMRFIEMASSIIRQGQVVAEVAAPAASSLVGGGQVVVATESVAVASGGIGVAGTVLSIGAAVLVIGGLVYLYNRKRWMTHGPNQFERQILDTVTSAYSSVSSTVANIANQVISSMSDVLERIASMAMTLFDAVPTTVWLSALPLVSPLLIPFVAIPLTLRAIKSLTLSQNERNRRAFLSNFLEGSEQRFRAIRERPTSPRLHTMDDVMASQSRMNEQMRRVAEDARRAAMRELATQIGHRIVVCVFGQCEYYEAYGIQFGMGDAIRIQLNLTSNMVSIEMQESGDYVTNSYSFREMSSDRILGTIPHLVEYIIESHDFELNNLSNGTTTSTTESTSPETTTARRTLIRLVDSRSVRHRRQSSRITRSRAQYGGVAQRIVNTLLMHYTRFYEMNAEDSVQRYQALTRHIFNRWQYTWVVLTYVRHQEAARGIRILVAGGSISQDQSSRQGCLIHASHLARFRVSERLRDADPILHALILEMLSLTENMDAEVNVWNGIGGEIDRFSESLIDDVNLSLMEYTERFLKMLRSHRDGQIEEVVDGAIMLIEQEYEDFEQIQSYLLPEIEAIVEDVCSEDTQCTIL